MHASAEHAASSLRDGQLELLWTARIDYAAGSGVLPHKHEDHDQLLLVLEGGGELELGGGLLPLHGGSFALLTEGSAHRFGFSRPSVTLDFKFKTRDRQLRAWLDARPKSGACPRQGLEELKHWFRLSLHLSRHPGGQLPPLVIDAGFKTTLAGLLLAAASATGPAPAPGTWTAAEDDFAMARYLRERWQETVTLDELAARFRFHPHYVIELFQQHLGVSPMQYFQRIKLEKAKEMLEFSADTVSEIASRLGWSLPYFSRLFRAKEGIAPTAYREQARTAVGQDILLNDEFRNRRLIVPVSP